jgi:hypothetical protein
MNPVIVTPRFDIAEHDAPVPDGRQSHEAGIFHRSAIY